MSPAQLPPVRPALARVAQVLPPAARGRLRTAVRAVDGARTRRAGADSARSFLAELPDRLAGVDGAGRSARLLIERVATVGADPAAVRALSRLPWTDHRFGLLDLACTTALDLVVDGRLDLADWLAEQILTANPDIRRAHEVQALVAVEYHRPVRARAHYARCVHADADSGPVRVWLQRQQARMAARAVFTRLAAQHAAEGPVGEVPAGDAVQLWQAAELSDDPRRKAYLQALAVVEASRPGSEFDAGLWGRRYLLERLDRPDELSAVRRLLDVEGLEVREFRGGDPSSAQAAPPRAAAPWPTAPGPGTTAVVFHLVGPQAERDLAAALTGAAAALGADVELLVVHAGLDAATVTAATRAVPSVRFVGGDVRRWDAVPAAARVTRRLMALDTLRLSGYHRLVLAPVVPAVGERIADALRHDDQGTLGERALRDDVVDKTSLVIVDGALTGPELAEDIDRAADAEFGPSRFHDPHGRSPFQTLRALRDDLVETGRVPGRAGFTAYSVPQPRLDEKADDTRLVDQIEALRLRGANREACDLIDREVVEPYQLTSRVALAWSRANSGCSRYDRALQLLDLSDNRAEAILVGVNTAWVLHDNELGTAFATTFAERSPEHPDVEKLFARFRDSEPHLPPGPALLHVAAYVGLGANYGDRVLPGAVRRAVTSVSDQPLKFVKVQAHQLFDAARRETANRSAGVIVGGGGLFLPDTAPNGNSGWQWNVPLDELRRIDVPLGVVAVGFNLFRGQTFSGSLFLDSLTELVDRAELVGLRNRGSIEQVRTMLPAHLADKVEFVPCPTTVLAHLDPTLATPVPRERSVLINAAYDRSSLRFGDAYGDFLAQISRYIQVLRHDGVTVKIVSHLVPDEQLATDLLAQHELEVPVLKLNELPLRDSYRIYREAGLVVGMRGHATMIPFGVRTPVLSLISHPKLQYFLDDIARPEWGFDARLPFEQALYERTRDVLANPQTYVEQIVSAQAVLLDAVQEPLRRFVKNCVG